MIADELKTLTKQANEAKRKQALSWARNLVAGLEEELRKQAAKGEHDMQYTCHGPEGFRHNELPLINAALVGLRAETGLNITCHSKSESIFGDTPLLNTYLPLKEVVLRLSWS